MVAEKRDLRVNKAGFANVALHADVIEGLNRIGDELTTLLGFKITRAQAIKHLIHFYDSNKGEKTWERSPSTDSSGSPF
jgi:hypothetical protein